MDLKKRIASHEDDNSPKKFRASTSSRFGSEGGSVFEDEGGLVKLLVSQIEPLLCDLVKVEVERIFPSLVKSLLRERKEIMGEEVVMVIESAEREKEKLKLVFCNKIASTIFTNNEITAENGDPLRLELISYATSNDAVICTEYPLSSAQIEFFVLDGEYSLTSSSGFNKSILSPRSGKMPLIIGSDHKLNLENGFAFIKNLCITDNSSWMKSRKFRLGAKVIDHNILSKFPNIGVAVSQPFRVKDNRSEVNKKHHPPSWDDEVWRLEGIGKDGIYQKNLASQGITNVGKFLKAHEEMGSTNLKKLLGNKVPNKIWKMMVQNALECVNNNNEDSKKSIIEVFEQKNLAYDFEYQLADVSALISKGIEEFDNQMGFENGIAAYNLGPITSLPFEDQFGSTSYGTAASQEITPNTMKDISTSDS